MRPVATTQTTTTRHSNPNMAEKTSQRRSSIIVAQVDGKRHTVYGIQALPRGRFRYPIYHLQYAALIHHHQAKDQRQINDGSEKQAPCRDVRPGEGQADAVMKEARAKDQCPEEVDQPHMTQERWQQADRNKGKHKPENLPSHEAAFLAA